MNSLSQVDREQANAIFKTINEQLKQSPATLRARINRVLHLFAIPDKFGLTQNDSKIITTCLESLQRIEELIEQEPDLQTQKFLFQKVKNLYVRISAFEQRQKPSNAENILRKAEACQAKIDNPKSPPASVSNDSPKIPENPLGWSLLTWLVIFVISGISFYAYLALKERKVVPLKI